ncbi:ectonucleotide pyrophosphatase/phosphodiesterase family member 5-like [Montipora foliosa]|uniref:ectonucleotide pyrophosphatase/phosphodiesterase family member 5-like n=1 Tax=Montipora foliosa TaxID=591990 RepID=UPI0035F19470
MKFDRFYILSVLFLFMRSRCVLAHTNEKIALTQPTLIIISYDGFRWDYMDKVPTPNLDLIVQNGVKAKHIKNAFVTKTFPNHFTLVTGLYEESHGLVGNTFFDPVFDETFYIDKTSNYLDSKWWKGEPIWITNQKAWKKSAVVFWPGSEVQIEGNYPTHYRKYNKSLPFEKRVDFVISMLNLDDPPSFLAAYFHEPDHAGHLFGPDSPEVENVIRRMDNVTGYLLENLRNLGLWNQVNLIITSDHGMSSINNSQVIVLEKYLPSSWYTLVLSPRRPQHVFDTFFHIIPKEGMLNQVYQKLKGIPHLNTYLKDDIPEEFHYKHNRRVMPIFIVADDHWIITQTMAHLNSCGNHGYSNKYSDMHPFFIAHGPAFKENYIAEPFENVHIYPLMCHILGIDPAPNNGSLKAVEQLLKVSKQDFTVLIVLCCISFLAFMFMSYGIVSFCVKNHCRMKQYGHVYDLGTSDLYDL